MAADSHHWRELCHDLIDEEYDWILLSSDFRGPDFVVLGKGAADSGYVRVVKALPLDQVLLVFIRPPNLADQPYLLLWSPEKAPFRHVTNHQTLKENFWLNFLAGGSTCPSKTVLVHTIKEACDQLDPTGNLYLEVNPPPVEPEPEPDISNLLAALDGVSSASASPSPASSEVPSIPDAHATTSPLTTSTKKVQPRVALTAESKKRRCQIL